MLSKATAAFTFTGLHSSQVGTLIDSHAIRWRAGVGEGGDGTCSCRRLPGKSVFAPSMQMRSGQVQNSPGPSPDQQSSIEMRGGD